MNITPIGELAWETCDDFQSQVFSLEEANRALKQELANRALKQKLEILRAEIAEGFPYRCDYDSDLAHYEATMIWWCAKMAPTIAKVKGE